MQTNEAQGGTSNRSGLFDSLRVYLNNKNRLQPIIGLGSIVECVNKGPQSRKALYLCEVCACRLGRADMRNHIMGSLHRYNYTKSHHPHLLTQWKENPDLSKLAWPLMDISKKIEGQEGSGDVQLVEVDDVAHEQLASMSENDVVTLINVLRDWQLRPRASDQQEHHPRQLERIVLPPEDQQEQTDVVSPQALVQTDESPTMMESAVDPDIKMEVEGFRNDCSSFLDGYIGTNPLIGLSRVVECRSENGDTFAFLCHCCRIRSKSMEIIGHLTSSTHLINYLMEMDPEQVEVLSSYHSDDYAFLQSLAKKVEQQEEGGGQEPEVVNVPESLSIQLTGKSYHWCVKMMCGQTQTSSHKNKLTAQAGHRPGIQDVALSNEANQMTKMRMQRKEPNTVFQVSLPLDKGAMVLERTSFNENGLEMAHPLSSDLCPTSDSPTEELNLDSHERAFDVVSFDNTSIVVHQQDMDSGEACHGEGLERNIEVTVYHNVHNNYEHLDRKTVSNNEMFHGKYTQRSVDFEKDLKKESLEEPNASLSYAAPQSHNWSSYYTRELGFSWSSSSPAPQSKFGTSSEVSQRDGPMERRSDVTGHYQQVPENQYMAPDCQIDWARYQSSSAEMYSGHFPADTAPESTTHSVLTQPQQEYGDFSSRHVPTTPQSYTQQATQTRHGVTYTPHYHNEPVYQYSYPHTSDSSGGSDSYSFIPTIQTKYCETYCN